MRDLLGLEAMGKLEQLEEYLQSTMKYSVDKVSQSYINVIIANFL